MLTIYYFLADRRNRDIWQIKEMGSHELLNWLAFYGFDQWLEDIKKS